MERTKIGSPPYETASHCVLWKLDPSYQGHSMVLTSMAYNGGGLMGMGEHIWETNLYGCDDEGEVSNWHNPLVTKENCCSGEELLTSLGYSPKE